MRLGFEGRKCKSPWALLTLKIRIEKGGMYMTYKIYKTRIS